MVDSHTLALNGPSEGLCEQYSEMIDRSLLLIRSWLLWVYFLTFNTIEILTLIITATTKY